MTGAACGAGMLTLPVGFRFEVSGNSEVTNNLYIICYIYYIVLLLTKYKTKTCFYEMCHS